MRPITPARSPVPSVATPPSSRPDYLPPTPTAPQPDLSAPQAVPADRAVQRGACVVNSAGSPGESYMSPEARAHEMRLMQSQAQEESIHRAAVARAEQRTRRLESQRWFGISNKRPNAGVDPVDGDYAPYWASNYPFYPMRWLGSGEPWGFVESQ